LRFRLRITGAGQTELQREYALRIVSRFLPDQADEAVNQKPGAHEQDESEGKFHHHQQAAHFVPSEGMQPRRCLGFALFQQIHQV
jgi:hypothetical protein